MAGLESLRGERAVCHPPRVEGSVNKGWKARRDSVFRGDCEYSPLAGAEGFD